MARRTKPEITTPESSTAPAADTSPEQDKPATHIVDPATKPRPTHAQSARKLPGKLMVAAGNLKVRLIDKGDNAAGLGIVVEFPEGRKPTDAEKEIIREHMKGDEHRPGLKWNGGMGMWHREIGADSPPMRNVALRLDTERRVEALAEALKQHQADPAGYADMVKARRESQGERTPE